MKLLARLLKRLGISVEMEHVGTCVVCGQGANPVLGVPIATTEGSWKHLVCMSVGRQIAQTAEENAGEAAGALSQSHKPQPVILTIVRPAGREIWN